MRKTLLIGVNILLLIIFDSKNVFGQITSDTLVKAVEFFRKDDTLVMMNDTGRVYAGQRLLIGKGSGEGGRYKAITFKSATALPLLLFRQSEINSNTEYQVDPSLRDADKVKDALVPGMSLEVKKIKSKGDNRNWHYFEVYLSDGSFRFKCDIGYALALKELLIKP